MIRPRIAHVISTVRGVGGAEHLLAALVREADIRGCDQLVINPFVDHSSDAFARLFEDNDCRQRACRGVADLPSLRKWVGTELARFEPEIVHVLLFHALATVATLPRRGAKRILTHAYGEGVRLRPYGAVKQRLDRWAVRRFDRVVAISRAGEAMLVEDYGLPQSTVTFIPPGWDGHPHPPRGGRVPTIVCVAKLREEKGHTVLVDAFELVRREVPDARLVLIGDGVMRPVLEEQVARLGLQDGVEFKGAVPEVWSHLAAADVFALASLSEAFGIAIVEAMAAGLPVVAAATGGIPELVVPGVTGELFPPQDHVAMAGHLVRLLRSADTRMAMGSAGRKAADRYRMDETVRRYFDLYAELLGVGHPTPRGRENRVT